MSERECSSKPSKHQQQNIYEGSFDHSQPRPPVPGEETIQCKSDWGQMEWNRHKASSPLLRKSYDAHMGYEPEGSHRSKSRPASRHDRPFDSRSPDDPSPPACLRWAKSLHRLLEDPDGVELFKKYLLSEGQPHADALDFWFACEGLRKQKEPERIQQLIKAIHRRFFSKSALPIAEERRREVSRRVKSSAISEPSVGLFDEAQADVEDLINNTTYPNFLKSDTYLHYIQSIHNPIGSSGDFSSESSSSSSSVSARELANLATGTGPLPIIHEDMEFVPSSGAALGLTPGTGCMSTGYQTPNIGGPVRLTKDLLLVTQKHRAMDVRPKPEAYVDLYMYRGMGPHICYNSYNPVSRQDSERQSLSSHSDARTESDNMSMTDSSVDGKSGCRTSRRKTVALNKETHLNRTVIPRTLRDDIRQCKPLEPHEFAAILIEKLEIVRKEQESEELLDRKLKEVKLKEGDSMSSLDDKVRTSDIQSRELANAIREKLQLEDDNDQDILDQHVSRVFSDLTPPGVKSPRAHSPGRNRWQGGYLRPRRKDKDGFSTFSSDSGNVHDFAEGSEHKLAMVKSKSMPEYAEDRFIRGSTGRRSSSKKTLTDLTDSGVSVVSDTPPASHGVPAKDHRVLAWLMGSEKRSSGGYTHSEMSTKHRGHRSSSATSPNASRHRKGYGSRSSSLERSGAGNSLVPTQPFVADPSMPPLPSPNTAIQLEEARRRLMEEDLLSKSRQRNSSKHFPDMTQSTQSTLRKSMRGPRPTVQSAPEDVTTVVFSFCDEQFPYRTKIPGKQITLRQFKDYLPKKGNYRYFFKTECEELNNQVIQEEISNDGDVLPIFEGKIMAQVKAID